MAGTVIIGDHLTANAVASLAPAHCYNFSGDGVIALNNSSATTNGKKLQQKSYEK